MSGLAPSSEEQLPSQIFVQDRATLEQLIHNYYAVLCRFAEKFLPDASLSKDVVQESFIKLWKSGKSFDSTRALKSYLYTTTRNGCLDLLRSRARLQTRHQAASLGEDKEESVLTSIIRAESIALIFEVVKSMPERMQQIFILSYREGKTVSEIAAQLGVNLKTVKKQKYKILVALRGQFGKRQLRLLTLLASLPLLGEKF